MSVSPVLLDTRDGIQAAPRPRIAFWSPLPPQRIGIADYSVELLDALSELAEVEIFVDDAYVPDIDLYRRFTLLSRRLYEQRSADAPFSFNVYQTGNNAVFNGWIYDRALKTPGLVVLHDLSLAEMHYERLYKNGSATIFLDAVEVMHGAAVRARALHIMGDPDRRGWLDMLMIDRLVRNSLGVVVHSAWARTFLTTLYDDTPIFHVVQPAPLLDASPGAGHALGQRDDLPSRGLVVGIFGGIARRKRVHVALEAFARLHENHPDASMIVVGREEDHDYAGRLRSLIKVKGLDGAVHFHGDVRSIKEMGSLLQAVDLVVNLRWPTSGETSAVMMRTFAAGKVVVTSNVPQVQEYPDEFCWKAPIEVSAAHEGAVVHALLERAAADRVGLERCGHAARRFMCEHATWPRTAARYVEIGLLVTAHARGHDPVALDSGEKAHPEKSRHRVLLERWEDVRRASERPPDLEGMMGRVVRYRPVAAVARLYNRIRLLGQLTTAQLALNGQVLDENERLRNEIRQLQVERLLAMEAHETTTRPIAADADTGQLIHDGTRQP